MESRKSDEQHEFYVYAYLRARDSENGPKGSPYYIGKGQGRRAYKKGRGEAKAPADKHNIVFFAVHLSESQALRAEVRLIQEIGRIDLGTGCLRNLTAGGDGGTNPSAATREKMRNAKLGKSPANKGKPGRPLSSEQREKLRLSLVGHPVSALTRQRISTANKGRKPNPRSIEVQRRMNDALRGKPRSEETKQKIRTAALLREAKKRHGNDGCSDDD